MPALLELLGQVANRAVGESRTAARADVDALADAAGIAWQDLVVEPDERGWRLIVESSYETARVEILVPADPSAAVEIVADTRSESKPREFGELFDAGRYEQAARVAEKRLVAMDTDGVPDEDPSRVPAMTRLAHAYTRLGKYNRAEMLFDQALELHERSSDDDDANTVELLRASADLHYRYRCNDELQFAETELRYRRAMSVAEDAVPNDHTEVGRIHVGLARLRVAQMRYEEAGDLSQRALDIARSHGEDRPDVADALLVRAKLHTLREEDEAAEELLRTALDVRERTLGRNHADVAEALFELADVLHYGRGQTAEAANLMTRGLEVWENSLGLDHPLVREQADFLQELIPLLRGGDEEPEVYEDEYADESF